MSLHDFIKQVFLYSLLVFEKLGEKLLTDNPQNSRPITWAPSLSPIPL